MDTEKLIENYQHQLAELERQYFFENMDMKEYCVRYDAIKKRISELEKQYFFENMDMKEYCVRYDAINKRISELENEKRGNTIWKKIKIFARKQKEKFSKIIT